MRRIFLRSKPAALCLCLSVVLILILRTALPSNTALQEPYVEETLSAAGGTTSNCHANTSTSDDILPAPELRHQVVNAHPFKYNICPQDVVCTSNLSVIVMIHSAPTNFERRKLVRETWGDYKYYTDIPLRLLFVIGHTNESDTQKSILQESMKYNDILQEDFVDTYRNLTYKFVAVLKYVHTHCAHVPFLLKTDDDAFVNVFAMMKMVRALPSAKQKQLMLCQILPRNATRNNSSKWCVTHEEWPADHYPEPCAGGVVLMSNDLFLPLYNASFFTPFLWLDDVFVTGILANKLGVKHLPLNDGIQYSSANMRFAYRFGVEYEMRSLVCYEGSYQSKTSLWFQILSLYSADFKFYNETFLPILILSILLLSLVSILFVLYLIAD